MEVTSLSGREEGKEEAWSVGFAIPARWWCRAKRGEGCLLSDALMLLSAGNKKLGNCNLDIFLFPIFGRI